MHFIHFCKFFQLFLRLKIIINSKKIFLNYLSIILFNQKMNVFDLFTIEKKIETLIKLRFLVDLEILKYYLKLTN